MSFSGAGKKFMDVVTYTGNGVEQSIGGMDFSPDLVWIKARTAAYNHVLTDTVRGVGLQLKTVNEDAEEFYVDGLTAFNNNGFTISSNAQYNDPDVQYVTWCWDAGDETVTNNDGTITSMVRANQDAGFSVVKYTSNGLTGQSVGIGLNTAPKMIIVKELTLVGVDWVVWHESLGPTGYIRLNSTAPASADSNRWSQAPTSSLMYIGNDFEVNANLSPAAEYIAYCWSEVPGYSKISSYTGGTSSAPPFVYTGFKPRWIMIKASTSGSWVMYDTKRDPDGTGEGWLYANSTATEQPAATYAIETLSNGFRLVGDSAENNGSNITYIYMAFAEMPMKPAQKKRLTFSTSQDFDEILNQDVLTQYPNATASGTVESKDKEAGTVDVYTDGLGEEFTPNTNQTTTKPVTPPSSKRWTWAAWVKRGKTVASDPSYGGTGVLYQSGPDGSNYGSTGMGRFMFNSGDLFMIEYYTPGAAGQVRRLMFNRSFADVSSWVHITITCDALSGEGFKVYFNGVLETDVNQDSLNPIVNRDFSFPINRTGELMEIGNHGAKEYQFDGYLADLQFIDGQAVTPDQLLTNSSARQRQLIPAKYAGWYGTRGYRLPMYGQTFETSAITNISALAGGWNGFSQPVEDAKGIAYGNGMYVSFASTGGQRLMYSTDAVSWNSLNVPAYPYVDVTFGDGKFVAIDYNHRTLSSTDGISWTEGSAGGIDTNPNYPFQFIRYLGEPGSEKFYVFGGNTSSNKYFWTSDDGISWTQQQPGVPPTTGYDMTYGNGLYLVVGKLGPGAANAMYSTDGVNFTPYRIGNNANPNYGVAYGNGVWVVTVGEEEIWYSTVSQPTSPIDWTQATYPNLGTGYFQVRYDGSGTFLVVGSYGKLLTSTDGINWTKQTAPSTSTFYRYLTYGDDKFVTISANNVDGAWSNTGTGVGKTTLALIDDTNFDKITEGSSTTGGDRITTIDEVTPSITLSGDSAWEVGDTVPVTGIYATDLHDLNQQTWAKTNIDATDWGVDTPNNYGDDNGLGHEMRGNYCTLGGGTYFEFSSATATFSNGNLSVDFFSDAYAYGTIGVPSSDSNKWYFEATIDSSDVPAGPQVGWGNTDTKMIAFYRRDSASSATIGNSKGSSLTVASFDDGDILGVAVDQTTDVASFYKNGVFVGEIGMQNYEGETLYPAVGTSSSNVNTSASVNFGSTTFKYPSPSGYKTLNTTNIEDGVIIPGKRAMEVVTYTGSGSSATTGLETSIGGLSFSPDLVWIKCIGVSTPHALYDTVRGPGNRLSTNDTSTEFYDVNSLTGFTSDGFTLGDDALYGYTNLETYGEYVAWCWDAGDTTVLNTAGNVASQVRANPLAGFSIVSWTGTGTVGNIGHGLGVSPSMIIVKNRSNGAFDWPVYIEGLPVDKALRLSTAEGYDTVPNYWNSTAPSSSTFRIGSSGAVAGLTGEEMIAYCWAEVPGFSKIGKVGSSEDERYVNTGFKPRWVMFKHATDATNWFIFDTERNPDNPMVLGMNPNRSNAQETNNAGDNVEFYNNGFKLWNAGSYNSDYVYAAFADTPLQYLPQ